MKSDKYKYIFLGAAICSILISVVAVLFSYRLYTDAQKSNSAHQHSLQTMQAKVDILESRLAELQGQNTGSTIAQGESESRPIIVHTSRGPDPKQQAALKRLEQIVDTTGLDKLAESENVDPDRLQKMIDEYAYREQIDDHRQRMVEVNQQLHRSDEDNFDAELDSLYQVARRRGRGDADAEERDKAFNAMLENYPDAFATGMVIAERALAAAFRQKPAELENYYNLLSANENFGNIVTDRGLEAVPNIQYYLARQYINEGRTEEAKALIDKIEQDHAGSYLDIRRSGRRRNWVTAGEATQGLRQQIE